MLKIFHLADIHLGTQIGKMETAGDATVSMYTSLRDTFKALDWAIQDAMAENPSLWIISGDLFHRPVYSRAVFYALADRIRRMSEISPLVILIGNHDLIGNYHLLMDYQILPIQNVHIIHESERKQIHTRDGSVEITAVGWIANPLLSIDEDDTLGDVLKVKNQKIIEARQYLNQIAAETPKHPDYYQIFVGHGYIHGFFSDDEIQKIGGGNQDEAVFFTENLAQYDYVAMGHIHLRKSSTDGRIVYPGSLYPVNFGESDIPHGYAIAEIAKGQSPRVRFRDIQIRPYYNLTLSLSDFKSEGDLIQRLYEIAPPNPESFVRLTIEENGDHFDFHPSSIYDSLNRQYGFLNLQIKNKETTRITYDWQPEDNVVDMVERFMQKKNFPLEKQIHLRNRLKTLLLEEQETA